MSGVVVGLITEYYTGSTPVENVADASQSGAATNLIYGLSVGMESTVAPVFCFHWHSLCIHVWWWTFWCFNCSSFYACNGGYYHDRDAYGPIADNAGGIAEMAGFDPQFVKLLINLMHLAILLQQWVKDLLLVLHCLLRLQCFLPMRKKQVLHHLDLLRSSYYGWYVYWWYYAIPDFCINDAFSG